MLRDITFSVSSEDKVKAFFVKTFETLIWFFLMSFKRYWWVKLEIELKWQNQNPKTPLWTVPTIKGSRKLGMITLFFVLITYQSISLQILFRELNLSQKKGVGISNENILLFWGVSFFHTLYGSRNFLETVMFCWTMDFRKRQVLDGKL